MMVDQTLIEDMEEALASRTAESHKAGLLMLQNLLAGTIRHGVQLAIAHCEPGLSEPRFVQRVEEIADMDDLEQRTAPLFQALKRILEKQGGTNVGPV
jgi:hypothetical protein